MITETIAPARRRIDRIPVSVPRVRSRISAAPGRAEQPSSRACEQRAARHHVVSEAIFQSVLIRERKRADRSHESFIVLLLALDQQSEMPAVIVEAMVAALGAARRETDVVGWFERDSVIGLAVTEIGGSATVIARELETRVRRELAMRLPARSVDSITVGLHIHPEPKVAAQQDTAFSGVDPLIATLRARKKRTATSNLKRALDLAGSLTLLAFLSPLFLVLAALVKFGSRGPVFFRQIRVGDEGKPFTILKFRTMYTNADHAIHQEYVTRFINSKAETNENGNGGLFKLASDPRITPIGHFLRKTSLDELPQFWNVVRGDMSLVGPRPPLQYEVEQYQPWHCRRVLEAKPGITGLWQVTGRSRTTFDEMVRLDLRYAKRCSVWTDIKILLATPKAVFSGKGAC